MVVSKALFSSASVHWATPASLYTALDKEFRFNDDPCPLGIGIEGLMRPWGTSVYVNPPYGPQIGKWLSKARLEAEQGKTVVMLLPSRTDTKWFHEHCLKAKEIRFLKGRLKFGGSKNSAPFPSCIVIFKEDA